jgi:selenocysteine-specific elongation factor
MTVVVGTAGHIDHGKTTLLRALTGIDADRLPEERRRGMTIDVGYAHLALADGSVLDFVDVPGHDRLVGNMLVGAGEIDAVLLVVAADDGPNAQTIEHLELLDAIGITDGLVAVTKADVVDAGRVVEVVAAATALVTQTRLARAPVVAVSGVTGDGLEELRAELVALRDRVEARLAPGVGGGARLAIDRSFAVRGRGPVATGSLRRGEVATGAVLRLVPGGGEVRVREVQVRGAAVPVSSGGRTALLVAGVGLEDLERGRVLTTDEAVVATSRVLVALWPPAGLAHPGGGAAHGGRAARGGRPMRASGPLVPADRERLRFHAGTAQADALVIRGPREAVDLPDGSALAILRLDGEVAAAPGDRFALRRSTPGSSAGGGVVLDALPPRGVSRRRLNAGRAAALATAVASVSLGLEGAAAAVAGARLDLHGALLGPEGWRLAPDVETALEGMALELVRAHHSEELASPGLTLPAIRAGLALAARRRATLDRAAADEVSRALVDRLVAAGTLARDGDRLRDPARPAGLPAATQAAMDRLELALSVAAPTSLATAAREAGCPPDGVRALETAGRLIRLEDDLAWATGTYRDLVRQALAMAAVAPLSPAAYRDATGSSRRYVLAILEDLDRRGLLRRTDAGHVLGPRTIARLQARAAATATATGAGPGAGGEADA